MNTVKFMVKKVDFDAWNVFANKFWIGEVLFNGKFRAYIRISANFVVDREFLGPCDSPEDGAEWIFEEWEKREAADAET